MKRIGLVVLPEFQIMCFSLMSVFEVANRRLGGAAYALEVVSDKGGMVNSSIGMPVCTSRLGEQPLDTLVIAVGMSIPSVSPELTRYLREKASTTRRMASVCLGAFVLGQAGLLEGRSATTHWKFTGELQRRHPACTVEMERIFVQDGSIWTSAGMAAGTDLGLGLVEQDFGRTVAREVTKGMVLHHRRLGMQSEHSVLHGLDAKTERIDNALAYAKRNLHQSFSIDDLARAANLGPRQFARVFQAETGMSPAKAVEALRLETAKLMMEQTRVAIDVVARETGFGYPERMRRAFIRAYGESPRSVRELAAASAGTVTRHVGLPETGTVT